MFPVNKNISLFYVYDVISAFCLMFVALKVDMGKIWPGLIETVHSLHNPNKLFLLTYF